MYNPHKAFDNCAVHGSCDALKPHKSKFLKNSAFIGQNKQNQMT